MSAHVNCLRSYANCGRDAARLALQGFFERYSPKNAMEALGGFRPARTEGWHTLKPTYYVLPWSFRSPGEMYQVRHRMMKFEARENGHPALAEGLWKGFGPAPEALLELELDRLVKTYDSIAQRGYDFRRGWIGGSIFTDGRAELISAVGGWHRCAALIALGFDEIPFKFSKNRIIISRCDAKYWWAVRQGFFSADDAVSYFDYTFKPLRLL
jgi:hypothetical protein